MFAPNVGGRRKKSIMMIRRRHDNVDARKLSLSPLATYFRIRQYIEMYKNMEEEASSCSA
jgi:hypothetical protein